VIGRQFPIPHILRGLCPSPSPQDFTGRVAIVTGAWRGLGRAVAARLHERGASVAVNARDVARAESAARDVGERALRRCLATSRHPAPPSIVVQTLNLFGASTSR
jgi:NAD(P)-dependent dehydrogenase (short-subunit alcohol dehydrogenase family)